MERVNFSADMFSGTFQTFHTDGPSILTFNQGGRQFLHPPDTVQHKMIPSAQEAAGVGPVLKWIEQLQTSEPSPLTVGHLILAHLDCMLLRAVHVKLQPDLRCQTPHFEETDESAVRELLDMVQCFHQDGLQIKGLVPALSLLETSYCAMKNAGKSLSSEVRVKLQDMLLGLSALASSNPEVWTPFRALFRSVFVDLFPGAKLQLKLLITESASRVAEIIQSVITCIDAEFLHDSEAETILKSLCKISMKNARVLHVLQKVQSHLLVYVANSPQDKAVGSLLLAHAKLVFKLAEDLPSQASQEALIRSFAGSIAIPLATELCVLQIPHDVGIGLAAPVSSFMQRLATVSPKDEEGTLTYCWVQDEPLSFLLDSTLSVTYTNLQVPHGVKIGSKVVAVNGVRVSPESFSELPATRPLEITFVPAPALITVEHSFTEEALGLNFTWCEDEKCIHIGDIHPSLAESGIERGMQIASVEQSPFTCNGKLEMESKIESLQGLARPLAVTFVGKAPPEDASACHEGMLQITMHLVTKLVVTLLRDIVEEPQDKQVTNLIISPLLSGGVFSSAVSDGISVELQSAIDEVSTLVGKPELGRSVSAAMAIPVTRENAFLHQLLERTGDGVAFLAMLEGGTDSSVACAVMAVILLHGGLTVKAIESLEEKGDKALDNNLTNAWRHANKVAQCVTRQTQEMEMRGQSSEAQELVDEIITRARLLLAARNATWDIAAEEDLARAESEGNGLVRTDSQVVADEFGVDRATARTMIEDGALLVRQKSGRGSRTERSEVPVLERLTTLDIPMLPDAQKTFSQPPNSSGHMRRLNPFREVHSGKESAVDLIKIFLQGTSGDNSLTEPLVSIGLASQVLARRHHIAVARLLGLECFGHLVEASSGRERIALIGAFTRQMCKLGHFLENLDSLDPRLEILLRTSYFQVFQRLLSIVTTDSPVLCNERVAAMAALSLRFRAKDWPELHHTGVVEELATLFPGERNELQRTSLFHNNPDLI